MIGTLSPSHHDATKNIHPRDAESDSVVQQAILRSGGFEIYRWDSQSVYGARGHALAIGHRHHFVAFVAAPTNVSVMFQFVSQVLPPSSE